LWSNRQPRQHLLTYDTPDLVDSDSIINPLLDAGYLPHAVIRVGIRRQLADRLSSIATTSLESGYESKMKYVELLRERPIAIETGTANEQHYEVGTSVLKGMLGPRMKYSSCLYEKGGSTLGEAEIAMLKLYVERAELRDGMGILDLGYVFLFPMLLYLHSGRSTYWQCYDACRYLQAFY
jgi:hypothetical protein